MFISLFFTGLWVVYGSILTVNDGYGEENNWQSRWTIDALWELTYFTLFLIISVMWAPFKNSQRFAFSYDTVQVEDDEEWQQLQATYKQEEEDGEGTLTVDGKSPKKKKYLLDSSDDEDDGGHLRGDDDIYAGGALDVGSAILKKN